MATNYIPTADGAFSAWANNFETLIATNPATYGLSSGDASAITAANGAFQSAYVTATDPATRTKPSVAAKDSQRATSESLFRQYAMRIQSFAGITPELLEDLGLTVRKTVPTPVPPPATSPVLGLVSATPGQHQLTFHDSGSPAKRKPSGVIGLELFAQVGTSPGIDPDAASYKARFTKTPFISTTISADKGKTVTYWARWTTRGGALGESQVGPWSEALSVIAI